MFILILYIFSIISQYEPETRTTRKDILMKIA